VLIAQAVFLLELRHSDIGYRQSQMQLITLHAVQLYCRRRACNFSWLMPWIYVQFIARNALNFCAIIAGFPMRWKVCNYCTRNACNDCTWNHVL